jgi:hypothetical protein
MAFKRTAVRYLVKSELSGAAAQVQRESLLACYQSSSKRKAARLRALGNLGEAKQKDSLSACLFVGFGVAFGNQQIHRNSGSSHVEVSNNQLHWTPQSGRLSGCRISIIAPHLRCR